jgi:protoporphyrinogen oxidase
MNVIEQSYDLDESMRRVDHSMSGAEKRMLRNWKVGIVGGGPGGLLTAYFLQKLASEPISATLFEASPRLGGKIMTRRFSHAAATYEAGAAELYDYSPVGEDSLRELVAELGLPITPMRGASVIMDHRVLSNLDDVQSHFGPAARSALTAFDRRARDCISPQEFYHADEPAEVRSTRPALRFDTFLDAIPEPSTRRFVETLIHSDLATEPDRTSVTYGLHNYLMNHPAYMQLYSIEGGNERIALELAARVRAAKRLEHAVTRIGKTPDSNLAVTSIHHGRERRDEFDFVVVALPNPCLPNIAFDGERLSAAVARHHAHYDHPAHYLRVTALFDRPFWRGAFEDSYCMLDRFGGCCLYDESSRYPDARHGVLGWLIGGTEAESLSRRTDEELIAAALDSLPNFLADGRRHFVEAHVHRWVGAVNAMPGGAFPLSLDRRHRPEPAEHPNLFLVGDYLFDSTLNGVLDSAEYVAKWIAANMAERVATASGRPTPASRPNRGESNEPEYHPSDHPGRRRAMLATAGERL